MIRAVSRVTVAAEQDAAVRILGLQQAYAGTAAVHLYADESGGCAAVCDGQITVCGGDAEEWGLFAAMDPLIASLRGDEETARQFAARIGATAHSGEVLTPGRLRPVDPAVPLSRQAAPGELWELLHVGFGPDAPARDAFYADASHRMRHGCWQQRVVRGDNGLLACAVTVALCEDAAVIGAVTTRPDARRRGYASACVTDLADDLLRQGKRVLLCPKNEGAARLYASLGFVPCGRYGTAQRPG